jgi:hypothetical protein
MTTNVQNLLAYVLAHPIGTKFTVATSQYADLTTPARFKFDHYSTAPAVRSLVGQGFIKAEYGWRYYDCEIVSHTGSGVSHALRKQLTG